MRLRHTGALAILTLASVAVACSDDDAKQEPPKIYFASDGAYEIAPTDTLTLEPRIVYDHGCTYRWSDSDGATLSTEREFDFVPPAMRDYSLIFEVENSLGYDAYQVSVAVLLRAGFGDLDNFTTKKSNVLALQPDTLPGAFRWNGVEFYNAINADTSFWAGFAYSNKTTTTTTISNSAIGIAYNTSSTSSSSQADKDKGYMAVNATSGMAVARFDRAYTPKSIDVANDNFIYLASKFGYLSISVAGDTTEVAPAQFGDFYSVVIEGLNESGNANGAKVEYKLVDCNYDNPAKYYRCSKWETIDLASLGSVWGLRFSVSTSKTEFPKLLCIDNLRLQD